MRFNSGNSRSAFGKVLHNNFLEPNGDKIFTQKRLSHDSGVSESDISRMTSPNSHFEKGIILYNDMLAIFRALAKDEMVGDISVEKAEELIKTIPDDKLSIALKRNLIFTLINEKIIKQIYTTSQNLPFIGRNDDLEKILAKLQNEQFVAITGTVGVGKSELAKQVVKAAIRRGLFRSVKIIYLQDKSTEDALAEIDRVLLQLPPNSLVLLDNCDYLKDFTKEIDRLRIEHPQLYILATSRVKMPNSDYPITSLKTDDAVQLFKAAAKKIGKPPTKNDDPKVEELCTTLLYGLPLALLLAAGLLEPYRFDEVYIKAKEENSLIKEKNYFSPEERHQKTLKALYEEHYQSLGKGEQQRQQLQALFRRLAIFEGPCRIKAVQAVCIINNDLPEEEKELQYLLIILARHFLITYDDGWIAIMHNLLRIYAILELKDKPEEASEVLRKLINYFRSLVAEYIDQQFNKVELEIIVYMESLNGAYENIKYAYKVNCLSAFPYIIEV